MATRTVRRMDVDGVIREYEEEYDAEEERLEQEWLAHQRAITSRPAAEAVLDNVEIMKLWCDFDYRWNNIEHLLYRSFDAMLKDDWWITRPIYYKPLANATRRQMLEEVCVRFFQGKPSTLDKWKKLLGRCAGLSESRNKLIHGTWGWHSDRPTKTITIVRFVEEFLHNDFKKRKSYTLEEIASERDKMVTAAEDLKELIEPLEKEKFGRHLKGMPSFD